MNIHTRNFRVDYLQHHPEYDSLELDMLEKYGKTEVIQLSDDELIELSNLYDY